MNLLSKCVSTTALFVASANLFGDTKPFFEQGMALKKDKIEDNGQYPRAYNAPACIKVDRTKDLSVNASFLYWYMQQDAMDVAFTIPHGTTTVNVPGHVLTQNFEYNPGFQVGVGYDTGYDGWTLSAEYTRYHNTVSQSNIPGPTDSFHPWTSSGFFQNLETETFNFASSKWKMYMDLLDVVAGRPFYSGRFVTISPSAGLRALWIRQRETIALTVPELAGIGNTESYQGSSQSWALGVVASTNARIMVWKGLRVDSTIGASLLYTDYTKITNSFSWGELYGFELFNPVNSSVQSVSTLRPTFDMGLGFGYAAYCFSNRYFFDLSARYDFNLFWSQNMMRSFASQLAGRNDVIGNLVLHGLTLNLRCDF
jgi:hypothetical protein